MPTQINIPTVNTNLVKLATLKLRDVFFSHANFFMVVGSHPERDDEVMAVQLGDDQSTREVGDYISIPTFFRDDMVEVFDCKIEISPRPVLSSSNPQVDPAYNMTLAEKELVHCEKKIQAIKCVRERTGLGLRESKLLVDKYDDSRKVPALKASSNW